MVPSQSGEPKRDLGQIHGHGVPVHSVEAALRDKPPRENHLVLVQRNLWHRVVRVSGIYKCVAELTASLDQERP